MEESNTLITQIEDLVSHEDLGGLEQLIQSLNTEDLQKYKTQLVDGCLEVFHIWYQDLVLEKINKEYEDGVISDLFAILLTLERIDPENNQHDLRARLYEHLADLKTETEVKLQNIQLAINEYRIALQKEASAIMEARLGRALLSEMEITHQFSKEGFDLVFGLFKSAFTAWSESVFYTFLHSSFRVLNFPCSDNNHWHMQFMREMELSLSGFAQKDPFIYLTWSNELLRTLSYEQYAIPTDYAAALNEKANALLENIKDYTTNDTRHLNDLGNAFDRAAKRMPVEATAEKLRYYEVAEKFYLKGHSINPAAWTFTVYSTNVQMAMARIYHDSHNQEKVIALFEAGKISFATTYEYDQGFTLTLYWGDFLIEYARLGYNFKAPDILQEAESKSLIAKEKGQGYYSQPFLSLAKIALKSGDKQKCLDIIQECNKTFTTEYYNYDFAGVLSDEDFREVWADLNKK
jgi:hypothetical protein